MPKNDRWGFDGASTDASEPANLSPTATADPSVASTANPTIVPIPISETTQTAPSRTSQIDPPSRVTTAIPTGSTTDIRAPVTTLPAAPDLPLIAQPPATSPKDPAAAPNAVPIPVLSSSPIAVLLATPSATAFWSQPNFGQSKVTDRIKSLNDLQGTSKAYAPVTTPDSSSPRHLVSPGTVGRALPFVRRDASATPSYVRSPLLGPNAYFPSHYVHSPLPTRTQPQLSKTMERGARNDRANHDSGTRANAVNAPIGGSEFGPVPGQVICQRHGRKLAPRQKTFFTTSEGLERSLSGAYVPTGRKIRSQVDALNPWALLAKHMTKEEGTTVSPEICPDCLAEHDILTRELQESSKTDESVMHTHHDEDRIKREPSSTHTEPGTPTIGLQPHNVLIGTADDHQTATLPGTAISGIGIPFDQVGSIVAADLGEMLDAIIIEHSGTLDKVITNLRDGMPGPARIQRLSNDLARVSEAVGAVPKDQIQHITTFTREAWPPGKRSMILGTSPEMIRKGPKSIPQLLGLIDATAEHLGLNMTEERTRAVPQVRESSDGDTTTTDPAPVGKLLKRPTLEKPKRPVMPSTLSTLDVPGGFPITPGLSTLTTAFPSPVSPFEPSNSSAAVPATGPLNTSLASAVRPNQDVRRLEQDSATAATEDLTRPSPTRTIKPSATASRARGMTRPLPQARLAPFQTAEGASKRTLVKPSEVAKQQRQQRTFEQDWLRDGSTRAVANTERSERRAKFVAEGGDGGVKVTDAVKEM